MNHISLIGRLTKEPAFKVAGNNKSVVQFTLAIRDGKNPDGTEKAQFIDCIAWEKNADVVNTYSAKGHMLAVEGRLTTRTYDKKDGTKGFAAEVVCDRVHLIQPKEKEAPKPQIVDETLPEPEQDDLPF